MVADDGKVVESIHLFKLFKLFGRIDLQATVCTLPALAGLLGNAELFANLCGRLLLGEGNIASRSL